MAVSSSLAPGFRFHPTDEELIIYYLKRKILNRPLLIDAISSVNLYQLEPWDLPSQARLQSNDQEWFFFCPLDRKNNSSQPRTNRATPRGYWKTTGKDREVLRRDDMKTVVGMKKTLVYHCGRAPRGKRTKWVMHEYRLLDEGLVKEGVCLDGMVVCRIFEKRGPGHQMGAQYGAPVAQEESEEEKGEDNEKEKEEASSDEIRDNATDYVRLSELHENLDETPAIGTCSCREGSCQKNLHVPPQNHTDEDIFEGLDGIDNFVNLSQPSDQFVQVANEFFEMKDFDSSFLEVTPNQTLNNSTDRKVLDEGANFFDSMDNIFNFESFAEADKLLLDGVTVSAGGESSDSVILQNHESKNTEKATVLAGSTSCQPDSLNQDMGPSVQDSLNNIGNEKLSDVQDAVPSPVRYSPLSGSLIRFLDSFSPPPAFASEFVPAGFKLVPEAIGFSSITNSKSKRMDVKLVSKVLRFFFIFALAMIACCKLAICVGAK